MVLPSRRRQGLDETGLVLVLAAADYPHAMPGTGNARRRDLGVQGFELRDQLRASGAGLAAAGDADFTLEVGDGQFGDVCGSGQERIPSDGRA